MFKLVNDIRGHFITISTILLMSKILGYHLYHDMCIDNNDTLFMEFSLMLSYNFSIVKHAASLWFGFYTSSLFY